MISEPVYEVFTQTGPSAPVTHVGSIVCHQPRQAWHLAKEAFGRRDDLAQLWVVPRESVVTAAEPFDPVVLAAKTRMPHRQPAFPIARRKRREQGGADVEVAGERDRVPATLWRCLADDLFLHAHLLAERIVDYVELETSLAVGSIAQEDLAHARTALVLCGLEPAAVDDHFFDRDERDWFPSRLVVRTGESWLATIARGLILSAAVTTAARTTLDRSVAGASTIEAEQALHFGHWSGMTAAVLADEVLRPEFTQVFADSYAAAADLFHTPGGGTVVGEALLTGFTEMLGTAVPAEWLADPGRSAAVPRGDGADIGATLERLRAVRSGYRPGVFA